MADSPDESATLVTTTAAATQVDAVGAKATMSFSINATTTQAEATLSPNIDTATAEGFIAAATDDAANSIFADNATLAMELDVAMHDLPIATLTGHDAVAVGEGCAATPTTKKTSLFAKLPGELRNRIYRTFFDNFRQQKEKTMDIKETAPDCLSLLHTDRMIRSEASSIFFEEYFCVDSFVALTEDLESAMESRVKAVCALVAIHDIHLQISITVQEMTTLQEQMVRQMPFAWNDHARRDFMSKLTDFIVCETHESFDCRSGSESEAEMIFPPRHMVFVGSKVRVSPRYRVERVDPHAVARKHQSAQQQQASSRSDAADVAYLQQLYSQYLQRQTQLTALQQQLQQQKLSQRSQDILLHHPQASAHQMRQRESKLIRQQHLRREPEKLKRAELLRVEGPLAELDWSGFE